MSVPERSVGTDDCSSWNNGREVLPEQLPAFRLATRLDQRSAYRCTPPLGAELPLPLPGLASCRHRSGWSRDASGSPFRRESSVPSALRRTRSAIGFQPQNSPTLTLRLRSWFFTSTHRSRFCVRASWPLSSMRSLRPPVTTRIAASNESRRSICPHLRVKGTSRRRLSDLLTASLPPPAATHKVRLSGRGRRAG